MNLNLIWEVCSHLDQTGIDSPFRFYDLAYLEQIKLVSFLKKFRKQKHFNRQRDSYSMKHIFEQSEDGFYINHGQFKGAMLIAGFKIYSTKEKFWNFNIRNKDLSDQRAKNKEQLV